MSWKTARLEEVAQILGGGTPSRSEPTYFGGAIAWATPTDVTALDNLYISNTRETITEAGLQNSSTKLMPVGAVLLTSRATIGYTAVAITPICTNQGFVNFICGKEIVPEYLAYWLRTQKDKMLQHAGGTTFKEIARGTLRKFEIRYPSLEEQRRIIDLLSRAEGIVRLRREAQSKAQAIIPALFIDMFGDPGRNPKGWPVRALSEFVARFEGGKNVQGGSEADSRYRILKVSAVTSGRYVEEESKPAPACYQPPAHYFVRVGDMLFSRANTQELVGATALVDVTSGGTLLPDKLWRFVWSEPVDQQYMHALFHTKHVRSELSKLSTGTSASMRNISQEKLFGLRLPIAPEEMQRRFGRRAAALQTVSGLQRVALQGAETSFQSLLVRAFSRGLSVSTSVSESVAA